MEVRLRVLRVFSFMCTCYVPTSYLLKVLGIVGIYIQASKMVDERFEPGESNANCNHNMVGIPLKMHQEISFYR